MGSGASATKGYTGKAAPVDKSAADMSSLPAFVDKDTAKGFCGDKFDEAAFDAGAKDGKVPRAKLLIDACLIKVSTNDDGLLPQPDAPKKQTCVAQIYVNSHEFGGTDKSCNGHRYDSIPFGNGMIKAGMACYLVHYVHSQHDAFFGVMGCMDAILCRCNPGQIKADGGDQGKFDDAVRALQKKGIPVWPSPDVMEFMGAKDALTKIRNLNIGMPDTGTYFTEDEFVAGFKKSMKFQPRVIKQNRGSSGEGIWIINLKSAAYCAAYGDATVEDSDELILMEANDNHVENHTVLEFINWCLYGRDEGKGAGEWTSKGTGKYLEGGKAAGGQLTDQRFCGRILEGELRYNMVNTVCLGVIHKVPAPGGMSAVGGTGSEYFFYDNGVISDTKLGSCEFIAYVQKEASADGNHHRCATDEGPAKVEAGTHEKKVISIDLEALRKKFVEEDCPIMMKTLELPDEPIPLWWTADMINASLGKCWEAVPVADQKWVVGEFNCSCVGVSKCLPAYCKADTPNVSWKDIPAEEAGHATKYGDIVGAEAAKMLGVSTMDCKFLDACVGGGSMLTQDEMKKMCESMECENMGKIGEAAEAMAGKIGFEAVLAKLQKDVGDETWQKILKEYEKYSGEGGAPAAAVPDVKAAMKMFFDDKGGSIDCAQFSDFMKDMGNAMTPEQCDTLFKALDINKDAKLSLEEFEKLINEATKAS